MQAGAREMATRAITVLNMAITPCVARPGIGVGPVIATRDEREGSAYSPCEPVANPGPRLALVFSGDPTRVPPHVAIYGLDANTETKRPALPDATSACCSSAGLAAC